MGIIGTEGFDYYFNAQDANVGAQNRWVKGFLDQQLVTGRFGGKAFSSSRAGGTEDLLRTLDVSAAGPNFTIGFAFKLTALDTPIIYTRNIGGTINQFTLYVESTGAISFKTGYNGVTQSTSATGLVVLNTWYYVEVAVVINSTTGSYNIDLDGVNILSATGKNTGTGTGVGCIVLDEPNSGTLLYDDMYWADDLVRRGPQRIEYHPPIADVAGGAFVQSSGASKYAMVNELATEQTNTISGSVGDEQRFKFEALLGSPAALTCVNVLMAVKSTDGLGSRQIKATAKSGASQAYGSAITLTASNKFRNQVFETDPATGLAWTPAAYAAMEAGIKAYA